MAAAHRNGLVPIICVGETAEDLETHGPSAVPVAQLRIALGGAAKGKEVVVAYEPVWAIGSGPGGDQRAGSAGLCGPQRRDRRGARGEAAAATRILYGGSVKASNIAGFMREADIDGALVGRREPAPRRVLVDRALPAARRHVDSAYPGRGPLAASKGPSVDILQVIVQVMLGITSLLLTLLILLHRGRGGGLSDMFGGGVTSNLGASGVAERNLNRITVILGLVWIASIVVLGLIIKFNSARSQPMAIWRQRDPRIASRIRSDGRAGPRLSRRARQHLVLGRPRQRDGAVLRGEPARARRSPTSSTARTRVCRPAATRTIRRSSPRWSRTRRTWPT